MPCQPEPILTQVWDAIFHYKNLFHFPNKIIATLCYLNRASSQNRKFKLKPSTAELISNLQHVLMIKMKPKPKACTSSPKCHGLSLLYRISITRIINWSSPCWLSIYLVEWYKNKRKSAAFSPKYICHRWRNKEKKISSVNNQM